MAKPASPSTHYPDRPTIMAGDGSIGSMSGPHVHTRTPPAATATEQPELRLTLKREAPTTGYVDGAWWPRSRDLSAELPSLLAALSARLGRVQGVSYNLDTWDAAPSRLDLDGRRTRLGGFHAQHPHTVDVVGLNGSRLTLLVLSPDTDQAAADQMTLTAAEQDNTDGIDRLLSAGSAPPT